MKKLMLILITVFGFLNTGQGQTNEDETITFGFDGYQYKTVHRPIVRTVPGGGIIKINYEGSEWQQNLERKNAFEHACRIFEEQMPTPVPLLIQVSFGSMTEDNVLARINVSRDDNYSENQTYMKRRMISYHEFQQVGIEFFSYIDAKIVFSNQDIFSYSLNDVIEDKYDFVTVALQQLARVCGINNNMKGDNNSKVLIYKTDKLNRYESFFLPYNPTPASTYNLATSGNVELELRYKNERGDYRFYSPFIYKNNVSLNYFDVDPSNNETILLQPNLPRGTSIRHVGKGIQSILWTMGWDYDTPVSMGSGPDAAGAASTDKSLPYDQSTSFGFNGTSHSSTVYKANNPKAASLNKQLKRSSDPTEDYVGQFRDYPILDIYPGDPKCGWSVSVLKKDGTWDIITTNNHYQQSVDFSPSMIDVSKVPGYSRSSDGFLRIKVAYYDGMPYGMGYPPSKTHANYHLLDYLPQKPDLAFSKVLPQTRSAVDDYFADVKIAFKNVEGTERILVEQLDEGARIPYTYYVDDVKDGYFIATIDKDYTTKFKLRAQNKNGETYSEQITILPLNQRSYHLNSIVDANTVTLSFEDNRGNLCPERKATIGMITDLTNAGNTVKVVIKDNQIDIARLNKGLYGLHVYDSESKSYSIKFAK